MFGPAMEAYKLHVQVIQVWLLAVAFFLAGGHGKRTLAHIPASGRMMQEAEPIDAHVPKPVLPSRFHVTFQDRNGFVSRETPSKNAWGPFSPAWNRHVVLFVDASIAL